MKTITAPAGFTASITSSSRFEPPGWMIARTPASSASCGPSANGKNASDASTAPSQRVAELARFLDGEAHSVDAAHLSGADADRLQLAREDDGVRRDVLADAPGEEQLAPVVLGRLAAHDLHRLARVDVGVRVLDQQAAHHAPVVALAR